MALFKKLFKKVIDHGVEKTAKVQGVNSVALKSVLTNALNKPITTKSGKVTTVAKEFQKADKKATAVAIAAAAAAGGIAAAPLFAGGGAAAAGGGAVAAGGGGGAAVIVKASTVAGALGSAAKKVGASPKPKETPTIQPQSAKTPGVLNVVTDALKKGATTVLNELGGKVSGALGTQSVGGGPSGTLAGETQGQPGKGLPSWLIIVAFVFGVILILKK